MYNLTYNTRRQVISKMFPSSRFLMTWVAYRDQCGHDCSWFPNRGRCWALANFRHCRSSARDKSSPPILILNTNDYLCIEMTYISSLKCIIISRTWIFNRDYYRHFLFGTGILLILLTFDVHHNNRNKRVVPDSQHDQVLGQGVVESKKPPKHEATSIQVRRHGILTKIHNDKT